MKKQASEAFSELETKKEKKSSTEHMFEEVQMVIHADVARVFKEKISGGHLDDGWIMNW